MQKTTLPYEDNYLDLDPTVKDPLGMPVCRITADFKDNERKVAAYAADKMEQWYRAAGATDIVRIPWARWDRRRTRTAGRAWATTPRPTWSIDGARARGAEPRRARRVGDGHERFAQPTLTVQALAWRTAEYLVKNWTRVVSR
jgi:hypothetical protein